MMKGGFELALVSVGAAILAVDIAVTRNQACYSLSRPPGHHAEPDQGMGFCCFNNVAIAAAYSLTNYHFSIKKVAIVDFDVHHGNGTEKAFYWRDDCLFISVHQDGNYPSNTGQVERIGAGKGRGKNVNIPLPPGSGGGCYRAVFDEIIVPALLSFKPDLLLVSSGFDASHLDPLGRQMVTASDFGYFGYQLKGVADLCCKGRVVAVHEGGYSKEYVPYCATSFIGQLSGQGGKLEDPFQIHHQPIKPHERESINRCLECHPWI